MQISLVMHDDITLTFLISSSNSFFLLSWAILHFGSGSVGLIRSCQSSQKPLDVKKVAKGLVRIGYNFRGELLLLLSLDA